VVGGGSGGDWIVQLESVFDTGYVRVDFYGY